MNVIEFPAVPKIRYEIDVGADNANRIFVSRMNSIVELDHTVYIAHILLSDFDTVAMTQAKQKADESIRENEKRCVLWNRWEVTA